MLTEVTACAGKVETDATLGIFEKFLLGSLIVVAEEDTHIGLSGILWILALVPDTSKCLVAVLLRPIILQIVGGIAHPLMLEVAMALLIPHTRPCIVEGLLRIVLIRLPLCALLPESATAVRALIAVAEARLEVVGSTVAHIVAIGLILERVTNLVSDGRAYGMAGSRCYPKGTDHIVVARASGHPPFGSRIQQVDLHLVIIEIRLALTSHHHTKLGNVGLVELLCLLKQVIHIHT